MTDLEIIALLVKAKELGITQQDVEAFKTKNVSRETVPDFKPSDVLTPLSVLDDLSDEEVQYWATPYFDEIQQKKEAQKQKLAETNND